MRTTVWILCLLGLGCNDFDPRSLLQAPRVVGVVADPPALGLGETVTLTSIEYSPSDVERTWSVCLASLGPFGDYACLDDSLVMPIEGTSETVDFSVDNSVLSTLATYFSQKVETLADDCGSACVTREGAQRDYFDLQINLTTRWADGAQMQTVKLVRVHLDDEARNTNPTIVTIRVDGNNETRILRPATRHTLELEVDGTGLETFVDSGGRTITEEATTTWYTTVGRLEIPVTFGQTQETELVMPKTTEALNATIMAVVRDGRGGTDFRVLDFEVQQSQSVGSSALD
ncbi:MAG: hypothetical protein CMH52_06785 [Myxococcales bacterium]|nr:hypothetical protein [Myxococcales bacterium]